MRLSSRIGPIRAAEPAGLATSIIGVRFTGWWNDKSGICSGGHGVVPHVAYQLGFGRVSCMHCIFASPDQLATIRWMAPERFETIAEYERRFGCTVKRDAPIHAVADRGRPYRTALARPDLVQLALSEHWSPAIRTSPERWRLPAGAFGDAAGPG